VCHVSDINALSLCHITSNILGPKAVTNTSDLGITLGLQILNGLFDDWVNKLIGVRIVTTGTLGHPGHEVKVLGRIESHRIAIKKINHDGIVAISSVLISHQLGVLPDAENIREVQNCRLLMDFVLGDCGVGFDITDLESFPGRLASVANVSSMSL